MDALQEDLQRKLGQNPDNATLKNAIEVFGYLKETIESGKMDSSTHFVKQNFLVLLQDLRSQGILGQTEDEIGHLSEVLNYLIPGMGDEDDGQQFGEDAERGQLSFDMVPHKTTLIDLAPWNTRPHSIHYELVTELNEVYFLHLLTTAPEKVLPPGKSLRSVLINRSTVTNGSDNSLTKDEQNQSKLHSTVQEIAQRAFWDEALKALQDPLPSIQIARLKLLYMDLALALHTVLPEADPSMIRLRSPLPPTTAPLTTALFHLHELLRTLRRRCAPVRDAALDNLIGLVEDFSISPAQRVLRTAKELLQLAEALREDISTAAVKLVSDESLSNEIARIARERERVTVWRVWGESTIQRSWKAWIDEVPAQEIRWIRRLMKSLGADIPVSCNLPVHGQTSLQMSSSPGSAALENPIPPVFIFSVLQLIRIQNELQAIVIAACLRTLLPTRGRAPSPATSVANSATIDVQGSSFIERVISLLMLEVDPMDPDFGTTKLINLGDEVLREIRLLQQPGQDIDEHTVRTGVDRVLRPNDPVFILLRQRLLDGLGKRLSSLYVELDRKRLVPPVVRAGRNFEQRPILNAVVLPHGPQDGFRALSVEEVGDISVHGFDDPVLRKAMREVARELGTIVDWIRSVWGGTGLEGIKL